MGFPPIPHPFYLEGGILVKTTAVNQRKPSFGQRIKKDIVKNWPYYVIFLPALIYLLVYHYYPMYGLQIAFRNYVPARGIMGSRWVGMGHFARFFRSYNSTSIIINTLRVSFLTLILGFPFPILLALVVNSLRGRYLKKGLQMISYAPHFISTVAMVGMINVLLANQGVVNSVIQELGGSRVDFLSKPASFIWVYVISAVWQTTGWNSVIYFSVLAGIDPQLHEAACIDGANRLQRIWHVDLPGIMPTMIVMLILNCGNIMTIGWEKIFLMQNPLNLSTSEVISTYVYKIGLQNAEYSYSTAVGLFNSAVNLVLIVSVNAIAKRFNNTSLW